MQQPYLDFPAVPAAFAVVAAAAAAVAAGSDVPRGRDGFDFAPAVVVFVVVSVFVPLPGAGRSPGSRSRRCTTGTRRGPRQTQRSCSSGSSCLESQENKV